MVLMRMRIKRNHYVISKYNCLILASARRSYSFPVVYQAHYNYCLADTSIYGWPIVAMPATSSQCPSFPHRDVTVGLRLV